MLSILFLVFIYCIYVNETYLVEDQMICSRLYLAIGHLGQMHPPKSQKRQVFCFKIAKKCQFFALRANFRLFWLFLTRICSNFSRFARLYVDIYIFFKFCPPPETHSWLRPWVTPMQKQNNLSFFRVINTKKFMATKKTKK